MSLHFNHVWMNAWKQQSVTVPNDCLNYNLLAHHEFQYIILLATFQTYNLEVNIWIISTIEWQQHSSVYVQESEGNSRLRDIH